MFDGLQYKLISYKVCSVIVFRDFDFQMLVNLIHVVHNHLFICFVLDKDDQNVVYVSFVVYSILFLYFPNIVLYIFLLGIEGKSLLWCLKWVTPWQSTKTLIQPSLMSRTGNLLFSVTTLYTTSHAQLSYSTASFSHPILLSAANRFPF